MVMEKVIVVGGGAGKNLCATRAVWQYHEESEQTPYILTGWPDLWRGLEFIGGAAWFEDKKTCHEFYRNREVLRPEPYEKASYRLDGRHLIDVYCECLGVASPKACSKYPVIVRTGQEIEWGSKRLGMYREEHGIDPKAKTAFVQFFGSSIERGQIKSFSLERAKMLSGILEEKGIVVFQSRGLKDAKIPRAITPDLDIRHMLLLANEMDYIITVDTWLVHAAAAMQKKALVFYGGTRQSNVGYGHLMNIQRKCQIGPCGRPELTVPDPFMCPFDGDCMVWTEEELRNRIEEYLSWVS